MSRSENDPWYAFRDKQTARTYSQDELDAAVAAERERLAAACWERRGHFASDAAARAFAELVRDGRA